MKFLKLGLLSLESGRSRSCCTSRGFAISCFFFAVSILQTPAYAAPFNLSENPNGLDTLPPTFAELPHTIDGLTTPWPVDIGVNNFVGTFGCLGFSCTSELTNQIDVFRIQVPSGIQVSNTFMVTSSGTHLFEIGQNGDVGGIFSGTVGTPGLALSDILSPGIYDVRTFIAGPDPAGYTWSFTAEAPEPSTMLLLGSGLVGLGYRRRKQAVQARVLGSPSLVGLSS